MANFPSSSPDWWLIVRVFLNSLIIKRCGCSWRHLLTEVIRSILVCGFVFRRVRTELHGSLVTTFCRGRSKLNDDSVSTAQFIGAICAKGSYPLSASSRQITSWKENSWLPGRRELYGLIWSKCVCTLYF